MSDGVNILLDYLPEAVEFGGVSYKLNTDFRVGIKAALLFPDEGVWEGDKPRLLLRLFYPVIPDDRAFAFKAAAWFFRCGREEDSDGEGSQNSERVLCFRHDAPYIYSAFYKEYGIDLSVAKLHWWKFCALLQGLRDCKLADIMAIRQADTTGGGAESRRAAEMKAAFALPRNEREQRELEWVLERLKG